MGYMAMNDDDESDMLKENSHHPVAIDEEDLETDTEEFPEWSVQFIQAAMTLTDYIQNT